MSTEPDWVDKVYNVWTELLETTNEAQPRKVKLQAGIHQDGNAKGADNRMAEVLFQARIGTKHDSFVSFRVEML